MLFLDHIEKSVAWGQVAFFNQLRAWDMRGRQSLQDLSLAGSGSVNSRLLVTFWKEEEILETTKLLSALIWPTAHNSCKSWILQGEKEKKKKEEEKKQGQDWL